MIQTGSIYRDATMKKPCILCVAITGSLPTKADNPAVPISLQEQIESSQSAFEAGATIAHCHVRNTDQTPSSDPEKFAALLECERLTDHCIFFVKILLESFLNNYKEQFIVQKYLPYSYRRRQIPDYLQRQHDQIDHIAHAFVDR